MISIEYIRQYIISLADDEDSSSLKSFKTIIAWMYGKKSTVGIKDKEIGPEECRLIDELFFSLFSDDEIELLQKNKYRYR